jgi:hypothetical protein
MPALFTRNQHLLDGVWMDAAWKIIRVSVAFILMLSICNVGMPVMLAIGPKEDKAVYETFCAILQDHFNVNLNGYRAVSDQRTVLRAVCIGQENQQALSLRHFLVSLKREYGGVKQGP